MPVVVHLERTTDIRRLPPLQGLQGAEHPGGRRGRLARVELALLLRLRRARPDGRLRFGSGRCVGGGGCGGRIVAGCHHGSHDVDHAVSVTTVVQRPFEVGLDGALKGVTLCRREAGGLQRGRGGFRSDRLGLLRLAREALAGGEEVFLEHTTADHQTAICPIVAAQCRILLADHQLKVAGAGEELHPAVEAAFEGFEIRVVHVMVNQPFLDDAIREQPGDVRTCDLDLHPRLLPEILKGGEEENSSGKHRFTGLGATVIAAPSALIAVVGAHVGYVLTFWFCGTHYLDHSGHKQLGSIIALLVLKVNRGNPVKRLYLATITASSKAIDKSLEKPLLPIVTP